MRFCVSILILSFNYLIICQRFGSSINLLSKNQPSLIHNNDEEFIERFYAYLNKYFLRIHEIQHITIVGGTSSDLRQAHLIYRGYPRSLCADAKKCSDPVKFSTKSLIVIFLEDLDEWKFKQNTEFLKSCRNKCKFIIILKGIEEYNEISSFFLNIFQQAMTYVKLLNVERDSIRIYDGLLTEKCSIEVHSDSIWTLAGPGMDWRQIHFEAPTSLNMKGCPIVISTFRYVPKMVIENNKEGTPTITGGRDGQLVLLLAEKLNFTINISKPPKYGDVYSSRKLGIINQVGSGKAEIGVGRLRPIPNSDSTLLSSTWHDHDCVTWGVPNIVSIGDVFWYEYSSDVWILIGLVFVSSCVIAYAHHGLSLRRKGDRSKTDLAAIILDIFAVNLGNPAIHLTLFAGGRLLLMAYLAYTTVITTGYKSSLDSALTTVKHKPTIIDALGIIAANLTVGGSFYYYQILMGQVNDSDSNRELVNRYVIYNNFSAALNRLKFSHDFALLNRRDDLNYLKSGKNQHSKSNFNMLSECVSKYYTVMVIRKESMLLKPIDKIIKRVFESGIQTIWETNETNDEDNNVERLYAEYTREMLIGFSKLYCSALAFSILVFFAELVLHRFKLRKKRRVVRRGL